MSGERKLPLLIFIFFFSLYLLTINGHYGGDGYTIFLTAKNIVLEQDISISQQPLNISEMHKTINYKVGTQGLNNKFYSVYGIGLAIIEVPFILAGLIASKLFASVPQDYFLMFAVSATNALVTAISCLLVFLIARQFNYSNKTSSILTLSYGLTSFIWPYSKLSLTEPLQTVFILLSILLLMKVRQRFNWTYIIVAGASLGMSILVKPFLAVMLPVFAIYLVLIVQNRKISSVSIFLLSAIIIGSIQAIVYYLSFGNFTGPATGYGAASTKFMFSYLFQGLFGLTLSPGKSFFIFYPFAIIAVIGFKKFYEKHRSEAILFLLLTGQQVLLLTTWEMSGNNGPVWHSTYYSWGPRYVIILAPLFALAAGSYVEQAVGSARKMKLITSLFVAGLLAQIPAVIMRYPSYSEILEKYSLGDAIFTPMLSQIIGTWLLLISNIKRLLLGKSLTFTYFTGNGHFYDRKPVSFSGYDYVDIWISHAYIKFADTLAIKILIAAVFFALTTTAIRALHKLIRILRTADR